MLFPCLQFPSKQGPVEQVPGSVVMCGSPAVCLRVSLGHVGTLDEGSGGTKLQWGSLSHMYLGKVVLIILSWALSCLLSGNTATTLFPGQETVAKPPYFWNEHRANNVHTSFPLTNRCGPGLSSESSYVSLLKLRFLI